MLTFTRTGRFLSVATLAASTALSGPLAAFAQDQGSVRMAQAAEGEAEGEIILVPDPDAAPADEPAETGSGAEQAATPLEDVPPADNPPEGDPAQLPTDEGTANDVEPEAEPAAEEPSAEETVVEEPVAEEQAVEEPTEEAEPASSAVEVPAETTEPAAESEVDTEAAGEESTPAPVVEEAQTPDGSSAEPQADAAEAETDAQADDAAVQDQIEADADAEAQSDDAAVSVEGEGTAGNSVDDDAADSADSADQADGDAADTDTDTVPLVQPEGADGTDATDADNAAGSDGVEATPTEGGQETGTDADAAGEVGTTAAPQTEGVIEETPATEGAQTEAQGTDEAVSDPRAGDAQSRVAPEVTDANETQPVPLDVQEMDVDGANIANTDARTQNINIQNTNISSVTNIQGTVVEAAPQPQLPPQVEVLERVGNRDILTYAGAAVAGAAAGALASYFIRSDDTERLRANSQEFYVEELPRGQTRETVVRENGVQVVTIYDRYGDVVQRSRILPDGREVVLFYDPYTEEEADPIYYYDVGANLPPLELQIPRDRYIVDVSEPDEQLYYTTIVAPPVETVERIYSVDEVRRSERIRDKVRRIDLNTVNFAFGSAQIDQSQVGNLQALADAIDRVLETNPDETFLLEGHTDAVGSELANLSLSDRRAEGVAVALTDFFGIPPENLVTQGYGEEFLKVDTQEANAENRRVTLRRITPLVKPVVSAQNRN